MAEDTLEKRIDILSRNVMGNSEDHPLSFQTNVKERIERLNESVDNLTKKAPNLKVCKDLIQKIGPILMQQRFSIAKTEEKVLKLLLDRENLYCTIQNLTDISRLSSVNKEFLNDVALNSEKLKALDTVIQELRSSIRLQTEDLDSFLDQYQLSMDTFSDAFLDMEAKLDSLESS